LLLQSELVAKDALEERLAAVYAELRGFKLPATMQDLIEQNLGIHGSVVHDHPMVIDLFHAHLIRLAPTWMSYLGLYALYAGNQYEEALRKSLREYNIITVFKQVYGMLNFCGVTWTASRGRRMLAHADSVIGALRGLDGNDNAAFVFSAIFQATYYINAVGSHTQPLDCYNEDGETETETADRLGSNMRDASEAMDWALLHAIGPAART